MMSEIPKNPKNQGTYKTQDFESYAMWKAMPSVLRGQPKQLLEKFGIDDEVAISLLGIRTQTEFAKRFNVDLTTLTEWNKKIEKEGLIQGINAWARKLTPNVLMSLYKSIVKTGKAAEVKTWYEIVENM